VTAVVVDAAATQPLDQRKRDVTRTRTPSVLDVLGELVGEAPDDADHHHLLLHGEIATIPVGDALRPVAQLVEVASGPDACLDALEPRRDLT